MAGTKQTFKYRDPRETRLLNQASKDQYGRQRNHVLYGFSYQKGASDNQIYLGRGAIYTQDGVKIFFDDDISFKVPVISPGEGLTAGAIASEFPFPKNIIIGIQHNFVPSSTAQDAKLVMVEVRSSQRDQEPAYYIQEIDTITLVPLSTDLIDADRAAYNGIYDKSPDGSFTSDAYKNSFKVDYSILNNITPILKIRIQKIHSGGSVTIPAGIWTGSALSDGVEIVRYKNMWNQLNDMIGVNLFEPIIQTDLNDLHDLDYPSDKRKTQDLVKNSAITLSDPEKGTPTQHPLFGTFDPSIPDVSNNYSAYRFASFLMDGRNILESMKRLDAWLRLLVNRLGEQSMVDLTDSLTELQDVINLGKTISGDTVTFGTDFILQNGKIFHVEPASDAGGVNADSHKKALHFLDNAIHYLANRLGLTPMISRAEIISDVVTTPELWDVTNPPGLDITANMNFHTALQTLRNFFTSRGNDVITGIHVYSLIDSDRSVGTLPAGQKTVISENGITVTDDTRRLDIGNGVINSSSPRSDEIAGTEVATLDAQSRYRIEIIAAHNPTKITNGQGPTIEGAINAPQGKTLLNAMQNVLDFNPKWTQAQLDQWTGTTGVVSIDAYGNLQLAATNELVFNPFISFKLSVLDWFFDLIGLTMSGGTFKITIKFYDGSFIYIPTRDIDVLTQATNIAALIGSGAISTVGGSPGDIPANAIYYKVAISYSGTGVANFKVAFGSNVSDTNIKSNEATDSDPRTLTRKDYVDGLRSIATGTGLLNTTNTAYVGNPNYGGRTKVNPATFGAEYYAPALAKNQASPHSSGTIGAALRVLASDGNYWYVPGIPVAQGSSCFCQCECECQCQCQCQGYCSCDGQCCCKGGLHHFS